ncbi:hypothetical protein JKP88DRAFT_230908 [Tribonema minus]|uniref:Uncharacterized protein n=1 Tax=Tribonema minus TaxID=303371 RepID=A0A835ZEN7_9STRA|nr:hypothetical protein JKP88DRAFT_230908 [Tribonema minus]
MACARSKGQATLCLRPQPWGLPSPPVPTCPSTWMTTGRGAGKKGGESGTAHAAPAVGMAVGVREKGGRNYMPAYAAPAVGMAVGAVEGAEVGAADGATVSATAPGAVPQGAAGAERASTPHSARALSAVPASATTHVPGTRGVRAWAHCREAWVALTAWITASAPSHVCPTIASAVTLVSSICCTQSKHAGSPAQSPTCPGHACVKGPIIPGPARLRILYSADSLPASDVSRAPSSAAADRTSVQQRTIVYLEWSLCKWCAAAVVQVR